VTIFSTKYHQKRGVFSPEAKSPTSSYEYLDENFSLQAAENFAKAVDSKIDFLIKHPESGRKSSIKPVRFTGIDKNRHLFYLVENDTLFVLAIFDNRQHPDKRPF